MSETVQRANTSTRFRVLDAAEQLYAERGIAATSLRAITSLAGVNLAAVNYHFGSKRALTLEVFRRRIRPVNERRIELLDALESGSAAPPLEDVLRAFVRPAIEIARDPSISHEGTMRLFGRIYSEPRDEMPDLLAELFDVVLRRFVDALERAVPGVPRPEILWRLQFLVGSLVHTLVDPARIAQISANACDPDDFDGLVARLVDYASAGFRAPLTIDSEQEGDSR